MRNWQLLVVIAVGVLGLAAARTALGPDPQDPVSKLTLARRTDNAAYGRSAYSFRYATQDAAVHRNHIDLLYNGCGRLHVTAAPNSKNRIAKIAGKALRDVADLPTDGWQSQCIAPEKGALYVLDLDDGELRSRVTLLVTDVSDKEVKLEWTPFRGRPDGDAATLGICGGPHECAP